MIFLYNIQTRAQHFWFINLGSEPVRMKSILDASMIIYGSVTTRSVDPDPELETNYNFCPSRFSQVCPHFPFLQIVNLYTFERRTEIVGGFRLKLTWEHFFLKNCVIWKISVKELILWMSCWTIIFRLLDPAPAPNQERKREINGDGTSCIPRSASLSLWPFCI